MPIREVYKLTLIEVNPGGKADPQNRTCEAVDVVGVAVNDSHLQKVLLESKK